MELRICLESKLGLEYDAIWCICQRIAHIIVILQQFHLYHLITTRFSQRQALLWFIYYNLLPKDLLKLLMVDELQLFVQLGQCFHNECFALPFHSILMYPTNFNGGHEERPASLDFSCLASGNSWLRFPGWSLAFFHSIGMSTTLVLLATQHALQRSGAKSVSLSQGGVQLEAIVGLEQNVSEKNNKCQGNMHRSCWETWLLNISKQRRLSSGRSNNLSYLEHLSKQTTQSISHVFMESKGRWQVA
jgi:hypothetical protein